MIPRLASYALIALASIPICACRDEAARMPPPAEIGRDAVAEFCGMSLTEHPGPKAQIFLQSGGKPRWFASVHDAFAYTMLLEEPKDVAAIYVNDMGVVKNWDRPEPGTWIDARKAIFVIEGRRRGGMDENEAVPFSDPRAAAAFAGEYGGKVVNFAEVPSSYILTGSNAGSPEPGASGDRPAQKREGEL